MFPWKAAITVQVNVSAVFLELQHLRGVMDQNGRVDLLYHRITFLCALLMTANLFFFFFFFYGKLKREGNTKYCLGSLVSPQFILTAAHCFTFGDESEHVTVEIDDGNGKCKSKYSVLFFLSYILIIRLFQYCIYYFFCLFFCCCFQTKRWKHLNYTQTTTLTLKQMRVWKSSTTMTWLWSS